MDELGIEGVPVEKPELAGAFAPFGEPVTPEEAAERLSKNLYAQLSEKSEEAVLEAISRACIYAGAALSRLSAPFDLDNKIVREVVLIHTVYELHTALGHEEAGKEYRVKAKDIIRAAWGDFPEAESAPERSAAAAVAVPKRRERRF
jgi:hypothetical protein